VNLVIAGNDETNYRQELDALAVRCNVVDRVHFIGPVHGPEKWRLLAGAEIVVVPSYSENFGLVALEAMACARPVVVTPEVGLASAVSESGAGLVVEGDPAKIAAGINSLLQNAGERRRMGEAGRWLAQHRFSWSAIAERMERVYRECLPKCAQQPPQASAVIQR